MCWLNPNLKKHQRIANYNPSTYGQIDWDHMGVRNKAVLLKKARDENKQSGAFDVVLEED